MKAMARDFRGSQASIARVAAFRPWGFVHALFYRILIFVSIIYAIVLLASLLYPLAYLVKQLTVVVWILATPQLIEVARAFSLVSTRGRVFGSFSKEYTELIHRKRHVADALYLALPYAAAAVWIAFFAAMLVWWP